jgi:hypothetical protein
MTRAAIGIFWLWFVFWTCAYVVGRHASENAPPASLALSLKHNPGLAPLLAAASILALMWILSGFRSQPGPGR